MPNGQAQAKRQSWSAGVRKAKPNGHARPGLCGASEQARAAESKQPRGKKLRPTDRRDSSRAPSAAPKFQKAKPGRGLAWNGTLRLKSAPKRRPNVRNGQSRSSLPQNINQRELFQEGKSVDKSKMTSADARKAERNVRPFF